VVPQSAFSAPASHQALVLLATLVLNTAQHHSLTPDPLFVVASLKLFTVNNILTCQSLPTASTLPLEIWRSRTKSNVRVVVLVAEFALTGIAYVIKDGPVLTAAVLQSTLRAPTLPAQIIAMATTATAWTVIVNASTPGTDMTAVSTILHARTTVTATDGATMIRVNAIGAGPATIAAWTRLLTTAPVIATVTDGATTVLASVISAGRATIAASSATIHLVRTIAVAMGTATSANVSVTWAGLAVTVATHRAIPLVQATLTAILPTIPACALEVGKDLNVKILFPARETAAVTVPVFRDTVHATTVGSVTIAVWRAWRVRATVPAMAGAISTELANATVSSLAKTALKWLNALKIAVAMAGVPTRASVIASQAGLVRVAMFHSKPAPITARVTVTALRTTCACVTLVITALIARSTSTSAQEIVRWTAVAIIPPVIARAIWVGLARIVAPITWSVT
jgi:hypothetical protein